MKHRYVLYEELLSDDGEVIAQVAVAEVEDLGDLPYALAPSCEEEPSDVSD